jgi:hypothetical protein
MLDFSQAAAARALQLVKGVVETIGLTGYILESGRSYHFYGEQLLDDSQWLRFLAESLLFGPVVDRRWVAHQLIESASALRISAGPNGAPIPRVVDRVS